MLSVQQLQASYSQAQALFDISFAVAAGEIVTLLGRNGAGKSTTIRSILRLMQQQGGTISFDGRNTDGLQPKDVARLGIGWVPEGRQVFPTLTVRENLLATSANRHQRTPAWTLPRIYDLFPRLHERQSQSAATLSGGEQQMLAIGRALMTNPKLLILDEATEGLAPVIRADIWRCVALLKAEGQSILITDKNIAVLKRLADRHFVIERGRTVWSGSSADLDRDADVIHRYVGV